jgi:hypothetical protein
MSESSQKRTQKSRPKQGDPVEIPVPKREDFEKLLTKAEKPSIARRPRKK